MKALIATERMATKSRHHCQKRYGTIGRGYRIVSSPKCDDNNYISVMCAVFSEYGLLAED